MTVYRPDEGYANEGCNSCASLAGLVLCFIACFILLVIAPLAVTSLDWLRDTSDPHETLRHQFCGAEVSCGRSVRLPLDSSTKLLNVGPG